MQGRSARGRALAILVCLAAGRPATAQLRPLDSFDWEMYDRREQVTASAGANVLWGQRAALAGSEGRLIEAGTLRLAFRTGRVVLEAGGTALRTLHEESSFRPPAPNVRQAPGGRRTDVGDFHVATTLLLTPPTAPAGAILRFGTRLPTTDNEVGLERDRTDFFALVGGRIQNATFRATTELGLGIHGTHHPELEQSDVLIFGATLTAHGWPFEPTITLAGHADGMDDFAIPGNEELAEIVLRLRTPTHPWVQLRIGRGLTDFSPALLLSAGVGAAF